MREEGGFGQSERRLVFHSLCLVSLWSRPASLPDYRSLLYSTYCVCCNHFLSYISGSNDPQHRSCSVDPISKRCWLYFRSWSLLPLWSVCTDGDRVSACSAGAQTVPYSEIDLCWDRSEGGPCSSVLYPTSGLPILNRFLGHEG